MQGFKPFFQTDDEGTHINLMSVGKCTVKKVEVNTPADNFQPAVKKTEWKVSLVSYPVGNTIELTGERAERFVEEYTSVPMRKSYL